MQKLCELHISVFKYEVLSVQPHSSIYVLFVTVFVI